MNLFLKIQILLSVVVLKPQHLVGRSTQTSLTPVWSVYFQDRQSYIIERFCLKKKKITIFLYHKPLKRNIKTIVCMKEETFKFRLNI